MPVTDRELAELRRLQEELTIGITDGTSKDVTDKNPSVSLVSGHRGIGKCMLQILLQNQLMLQAEPLAGTNN